MFAVAPRANAQQPDGGEVYAAAGRVSFGAEVSVVGGRRDDDAFFNYTDYRRNTLRMSRLRVMGEWRVATRLAFVGEARTENADSVGVPALYVRWRPFDAHDISVQAGRVPPVIGAFPRRAYGHDNLVIGAPLAYQYLTSLRPDAVPATVDELLTMRARGWQPSYTVGATHLRPGLPLASGLRWDTGVEVSWRRAPVQLAFALTRAAPSRALAFDDRSAGPGWSARVASVTPAGPVIGVSAASGPWLEPALAMTAGGASARSAQRLFGLDAEYGRGPWLARGEWIRTIFTLPLAGPATDSSSLGAWSGYVEGRYRLAPRWQLAARAETLRFADVTDSAARVQTWDADVHRVEGAFTFRLLRQAQIKAAWQHDWRRGGRVRTRGFPAVEFLCWF